MNEIILSGCSPAPLASYLKGLGVLRLLSARHPETKAAWRNEFLLLQTALTGEQVEQFFLQDYCPTPVMAPWNGASGFYDKDNKDALKAILKSDDTRLSQYRNCLGIAEQALAGINRGISPKGDEKNLLLARLRSILPDEAIGWLDAAVILLGGKPDYPRLLGTGGNDGHLDFTNNFMQHLVIVLCLSGKIAKDESKSWLQLSLFGGAAPGLVEKKIGQFSPAQAGGPNSTTGFIGEAVINPWDFVLMIEGALPFAAAAVRRNADDRDGALSFPFTVRTVVAGSGSLGEGDSKKSRDEIWMPLWDQLASYPEVRSLLAEGRIALGRKPARDALDFVRATRHFGSYRGIRSFQRYALLKRNGDAHFATPVMRVEVKGEPSRDLLDDLDRHGWLEKFRRFAQSDAAANRFRDLRHRLENAFFDFSGEDPSPRDAQAILALLGEIQSALGHSSKARKDVDPLPLLSQGWIKAANDDTPAFRIACALAGLRGAADIPLPLRAQLFPIHPRYSKWINDSDKGGNDPISRVRIHTDTSGNLTQMLRSLLERRLWLAEKLEMRDRPLLSPAGATLDDVAAFLRSDSMDGRVASLLPGLSLCSIPDDYDRTGGGGSVPAAFSLLKLCLSADSVLCGLGVLGKGEHLPLPAGILAQLASGYKPERAVLSAWRRLHASGLNPVFGHRSLPSIGVSPKRAAAALLIPLRYGASSRLAYTVLKTTATSDSPAS